MPFSYGAYDMIASFHELKRFSPEAEDARGTRTRLDLGQGYVDCRKGAGVKLKRPPRKRRRGGRCLRRAAPQTKTAAIAGGRFVGAKRVLRKTVIVRRRKRSWQVWQRPTLPNLKIQY